LDGGAFLQALTPPWTEPPVGNRELPVAVLLALLAGLLALTVRILLLLSGLLAAALLLARLLTGVLILLTGILVLIGHRDLLFKVARDNPETAIWLRETSVPPRPLSHRRQK
jgi:hypothetical protein